GAARDAEHRHAGHPRQGLGGAALGGRDRVAMETLELLASLAAAGTPCVLATVVSCEAPTSARPGDKAVIAEDGSLTGWIGGGCSEPAVRREALRALADALAHPAVDVALVASGRRARSVLDGLREQGFDEAELARVRTPAGGTRGASQEEIALAAVAEIAALRRQRRRPAAAPGPARFATDPV